MVVIFIKKGIPTRAYSEDNIIEVCLLSAGFRISREIPLLSVIATLGLCQIIDLSGIPFFPTRNIRIPGWNFWFRGRGRAWA